MDMLGHHGGAKLAELLDVGSMRFGARRSYEFHVSEPLYSCSGIQSTQTTDGVLYNDAVNPVFIHLRFTSLHQTRNFGEQVWRAKVRRCLVVEQATDSLSSIVCRASQHRHNLIEHLLYDL